MNANDECIRHFHPEGEQGLSPSVDGQEEEVLGRSEGGKISRVVSSFLEQPQGLQVLSALRIAVQFGEESLALGSGYPFE